MVRKWFLISVPELEGLIVEVCQKSSCGSCLSTVDNNKVSPKLVERKKGTVMNWGSVTSWMQNTLTRKRLRWMYKNTNARERKLKEMKKKNSWQKFTKKACWKHPFCNFALHHRTTTNLCSVTAIASLDLNYFLEYRCER